MDREVLANHQVRGVWQAGEFAFVRGLVIDYRAGLLVTSDETGKEAFGDPKEFQAESGEDGDSVLVRVLRPPKPSTIRHGAFREAIAAARGVAQYGFQETRAWDTPSRYVVDTGEGGHGVVQFIGEGCVGAMALSDPLRRFDALSVASNTPPEIRATVLEVCSLPLLATPPTIPLTALFWSAGEPVSGGETWPCVYKYGAEILLHEFLDDATWAKAANDYYELTSQISDLVVEISRRRSSSDERLQLTASELSSLLGPEMMGYQDALRLLNDAGVFPPFDP